MQTRDAANKVEAVLLVLCYTHINGWTVQLCPIAFAVCVTYSRLSLIHFCSTYTVGPTVVSILFSVSYCFICERFRVAPARTYPHRIAPSQSAGMIFSNEQRRNNCLLRSSMLINETQRRQKPTAAKQKKNKTIDIDCVPNLFPNNVAKKSTTNSRVLNLRLKKNKIKTKINKIRLQLSTV